MKKIIMYELLGMIKDKKIPNTIKIKNEIWDRDYSKNRLAYQSRKSGYWLNFAYYIEENKLNEKVEVLDD